jgi:ABC-2 type transport system ATP-binding protein
MADNRLTASGLSAGYRGEAILRDVSFTLSPGVHVLLGPNGAGKTTLFRALTGVITPLAGKITMSARAGTTQLADTQPPTGTHPSDSEPVATQPVGVALAAHRPALAPRLSVRDNVRYWGRVLGLDQPTTEKRSTDALRRLRLEPIADQRAATLSRGQAQRVNVAKALLAEPQVLLLDEPFAGVDPGVAAELRDHLRELADRQLRIVVVSTHDLADVTDVADEVLVLRSGRLIAHGRAAALRAELLGTAYRLRVKAFPDPAPVLRSLGYRFQPATGGAFDIDVPDEEAARTVVAALVEAGVGVHEARPAEGELNEIYRSLSQGEEL